MDRIDKILFIFPFMPLADMVSTFFSLSFGTQETGIIARPIYESYGELGLVTFASLLFLIVFGYVGLFRYGKRKLSQKQASRLERFLTLFGIEFAFVLEAIWLGAIIQNFLVPFIPPLAPYVVWGIVSFTFFVSVTFFTQVEMKRFARG